ncbi:MAG: succinylglutamate desuccinylase/aspartoacylase family protein [Agarilytica sp.]
MLKTIRLSELTLPETPEAWLQTLSSACVIEIPGRDGTSWRVASVLVHGNEPSGFIAAHQFLKRNIVPKTNLALVIGSVRAAKHKPVFTHRQIPGEFDLNRRFGHEKDCHDRVTETARDISHYITSLSPQYVIDLHNTSGSGPAFAVSISDTSQVKKLASLFTPKMVITHLVVGSLMEEDFACPTVTIECGGAGQQDSHNLAFEGLCRFAQFDSLDALDQNRIQCFYHPTRVEIHQGISLDYGTEAAHEVDITLIDNIEALNQHTVKAGTLIGWLERELEDCLLVRNEQGEDKVNDFFTSDNGKLLAKQDLQIFMATHRADIAMSDCLFYAVEAG